MLEQYKALGVSDAVLTFGEGVLADLKDRFAGIDAIAEANARGSGVASLKGKMIDKPVVTRARRLLDLYEAGSKIDEVEEI